MTSNSNEQDVVNIKPESILVIGDVYGEFDFIFERIKTINDRNGPFDLVLFVGDFFGKNGNKNIIPYINNQKQIPIQSYFITTDCNIQHLNNNGNKICDNLYYLGKFGIKTINSLKIAYLSGTYNKNNNNNNNNKYYTMTEIENGYKSHNFDNNDIDILLTNEATLDNINNNEMKYNSTIISSLINKCKPQYHFSGMNEFYFQLSPFNYIENEKSCYFYKTTIIIGLSSIPLSPTFNINAIKQKRHELSSKKYIYSARVVSLRNLHPISLNLNNNKTDEINVNFNDKKYFLFVKSSINNPLKPKLESNDNNYCKYCNICLNDNKFHLIICEGKHSLLVLSSVQKSYIYFELTTKKHLTNMLSIVDNEEIESEIDTVIQCVCNYFKPNILFFYEINNGNKFHCTRNLICISSKFNDNKNKNKNKLKYILQDINQTHNIQFQYVENEKIINSMVTQYGYIDIAIYLSNKVMRYIYNITPAKKNVNYVEIVNQIIKQLTLDCKNRNELNTMFTIQQEKQYAHKIKQLFQKFNPF